MLEFNFKTEIDPIAVVALLVSFLSSILSYLSYKSNKFNLRVQATGDMITVPDNGYGKKICVDISNIGGKSVKINNIAFTAGDYKKSRGLIPSTTYPSLPIELKVGDQIRIMVHQDRLVEAAGKAYLKCNISASFSKNPIVTQVKFADG